MNEQDIKKVVDCFDKVEPLPIQEEKMLKNILKHKKGGNLSMQKTRRFTGKLIAAVVAAVVLVAGAAVAINHFWPEAEVMRQLMQGNEIVVNGVIVDAPPPYLMADSYDDEEFMEAVSRLGLSMVMVPKEPIAAELGIEITVALPAEAEARDGYTFVPLTFFRDEVGVLQVYVFEGQVVIENREDFVMM